MKFTIGLPIIKTEYLKATLEGIQNQNFSDYEVIIKNNANTHEKKREVKKICSEWIEKENVQYYESEKQLSMTSNFNTILQKARGEYFLIMSDDDIMQNNFLQEINKLILKYPKVEVFHGRVKRIDGNDNLIDFSENCPEFESQIDFVYHRIMSKRTLYLSDFVVSTKTIKEDGGFTELPKGWGLDEITWSKLSKNGIAFSPEIILKYRRFLGNFSMNKSNLLERFEDINIMNTVIEKIIIENCKDGKSIYPLEYLLKLNSLRILKQKDYVLNHYAKSNSLIAIASFYYQNKNQLSLPGLIRVLAMKTFFKDKLYNAI